ncbi:ATPase [Gluconacetobacter azotocaptans]|uniref:BadF/BadG/BcrA/BcrD ATPase family protein n=1 Tax=Gluconacetobacter azotocaptans TaxID=142834 RepID=UPI00195D7240|nr:BadF/BadG/BcrA/BcrD ATPase family protein [Gluconacetobacter azotocaptans]MBM9402872.1 ATPase [Gluconacetobacter azotocaptans]
MAVGRAPAEDARTVLVGIDGGGTATRLRLATPDGTILGTGQGGPANIATDAECGWRSVRDALDQAMAQAGLSPVGCRLVAGAGLAGAEVPEARARFMALPAIFTDIEIVTDAYTSCVGAHGGQDGAMVAAGTGTVGYAVAGGQTRRVGGWGFPQGDEGGGAWIGLEVIRLMLRAGDGRAPRTALTEAIRNRAGADGGDPMIWAVGARPADFACLVPQIVAAAGQGDAQARALLARAGAEIDGLMAALLEGDGFGGLPCCLVGGLADVLRPCLSPWSRSRLSEPRGGAIEGALVLAGRLHSGAIGRE